LLLKEKQFIAVKNVVTGFVFVDQRSYPFVMSEASHDSLMQRYQSQSNADENLLERYRRLRMLINSSNMDQQINSSQDIIEAFRQKCKSPTDRLYLAALKASRTSRVESNSIEGLASVESLYSLLRAELVRHEHKLTENDDKHFRAMMDREQEYERKLAVKEKEFNDALDYQRKHFARLLAEKDQACEDKLRVMKDQYHKLVEEKEQECHSKLTAKLTAGKENCVEVLTSATQENLTLVVEDATSVNPYSDEPSRVGTVSPPVSPLRRRANKVYERWGVENFSDDEEPSPSHTEISITPSRHQKQMPTSKHISPKAKKLAKLRRNYFKISPSFSTSLDLAGEDCKQDAKYCTPRNLSLSLSEENETDVQNIQANS
jgi:hypothetical protein